MPDETRAPSATPVQAPVQSPVHTPERVPERLPERDARVLREAASGALALRFPARWLEEHAVLPLSLADGVAEIAAEGTIAPVVGDVLTRSLQARLSVRTYPSAEIRAALVADIVPPGNLTSASSISRTTTDSARIAGALAGAGLFAALGFAVAYLFVSTI